MARRIGYTVRRLPSGRYQVLVRGQDGKQVGVGAWASKHLAPQLVAVLDRHMTAHVPADPSAPVFTGVRGGRLSQQVLRDWWPGLCVSCGLPGLHFHDLRHFAATAYALTGATTKEIMEHIGHSTQAASIRYQHAATHRKPELAVATGALWVEPEQAPPVNVRKIRRA